MASEGPAYGSLPWERVATVAELKAARGRLNVRLSSGRGVLLSSCEGETITALDHSCYHHGAPLIDGDIEDVGGVKCVVCPWHKYKIAVQTGDCLYVGIDIASMKQTFKSKGIKQRPHFVKVHGSSGDIFVADTAALQRLKEKLTEEADARGEALVIGGRPASSPLPPASGSLLHPEVAAVLTLLGGPAGAAAAAPGEVAIASASSSASPLGASGGLSAGLLPDAIPITAELLLSPLADPMPSDNYSFDAFNPGATLPGARSSGSVFSALAGGGTGGGGAGGGGAAGAGAGAGAGLPLASGFPLHSSFPGMRK